MRAYLVTHPPQGTVSPHRPPARPARPPRAVPLFHFGVRPRAGPPRDAAARQRSPLFGYDGSLLRSGWLVSGIARRPLQPTPTEPLHPFIPNSMLFRATELRCVRDAEPSAADMPAVEGAWACTQFALRHASESHAIYDLSLLTGRTHQIRVHFAAAGLPLAGSDAGADLVAAARGGNATAAPTWAEAEAHREAEALQRQEKRESKKKRKAERAAQQRSLSFSLDDDDEGA